MEGDLLNTADGWYVMQLGLSIGASSAAVIAALWGFWKLCRRAWDTTIGRRKAQTAILDQLACTASQEFVEDLLGVPRFVLKADVEERLYRLPGAWVAIQFKDSAVNLLSITITDSRMWHHTGGATLGTIDVRLGLDTFADVRAPKCNGEHMWTLPQESGYYRHYHFDGAGGGSQHFWLSFNTVGSGMIDSGPPYASGSCGDLGDTPPDPARITPNTLTILSPFGSISEDVCGREIFGPHSATLNLMASERTAKRVNSCGLLRMRR